MTDEPVKTIWDIVSNLKFDEPLDPAKDELFVSTDSARGEVNFNRIFRPLGIDSRTDTLMAVPDKNYTLFCGHTGCGKSTELRCLRNRLDDPERYFVVFVDALTELDIRNFSYADLFMALANKLLESLSERSVTLDQVFLTRLEEWFTERIEKHEKTKEFAADVKSGVKGETGVPFLAKIFSSITASFKINSTYKEELRKNIKNSFSEFSLIFNDLIIAAEEEILKKKAGKKILFIVDGIDRLNYEDGKKFFEADVDQLQLIHSNFIYCAPIGLLYEEDSRIQDLFNVFTLPMIKIRQKFDETKLTEGYDILREMLYKRVPELFFDSKDTADYLIEYSGGNPRHLIRLANYTFQNLEGDIFDRKAAERAVKQMATEIRRTLDAGDFKLLYDIDHAEHEAEFQSEESRKLLYKLALLEYNSFWWLSHPAIRTLPAYKRFSSE